MPIIGSDVVTHTISSITFKDDGSVSVSLVKEVGTEQKVEVVFNISMEVVAPLIDIPIPHGFTVREYIIYTVYRYLVDSHQIEGVIS